MIGVTLITTFSRVIFYRQAGPCCGQHIYTKFEVSTRTHCEDMTRSLAIAAIAEGPRDAP